MVHMGLRGDEGEAGGSHKARLHECRKAEGEGEKGKKEVGEEEEEYHEGANQPVY